MQKDKFHIECYDAKDEELLEYVTAVADEFAPDISIDDRGVPYKGASQAPFIFKRRYNNGSLKAIDKYSIYKQIGCETAQDIIKALGIDPEKFWYLLLFVSDYVKGSTINTLKTKTTPKEEIEQFVKFIEQHESDYDRYIGISYDKPVKLTLHVAGQRLIINNPNTLSTIAYLCKQGLSTILPDSLLNNGQVVIEPTISNSIQIWLFAKMLRCFFDLYPQFTGKRKTGNTTTKSVLQLISKLVYLMGLTYNKDYNDDTENLKAIIKQYRNYTIDTINSIYG